jgi:glutathione synthase/RimK-type ligase-like ATP-grasp enzyme
MQSFINQAAINRGWDVKKIVEEGDYLTKFSKGDIFFYSEGVSNIPINHQGPAISKNKVHTSHILEKENIPCVITREIQLDNSEHIRFLYQQFSNDGQNQVVIKPIDGKKGEGLVAFDSLEQLVAYSHSVPKEIRYCISSLFEHQCELRLVLFRQKVEFHYLKPNNADNVLRPHLDSSYKIKDELISKMKELAERAAYSLGFDYLAVDFLVGESEEKVLEVNLRPNLYSLIRTQPEMFDRCIELYERMFDYKEFLLNSPNQKFKQTFD